jgi:hypothetical protein
MKEQYTLRVKRGSELDALMQAFADGDFFSDEEAAEVGGLSRSWMIARRWLPMWFDNVTVSKGNNGSHKMHYVNIKPDVVQHITNADFKVDGTGNKADDSTEVGELIWPDAPPFVEPMENFRKPSFYNTMKTVVEHGKHISLAGPPGIGKTTSVEQLAADVGMPLVSVGGEQGFRKRDLIGTQEIINGTTKFLVAEFAAAAVNGWWAKIDEANAADADAIMVLNAVTSAPYVINIHGKQYPVHPNFRLFITYNHGLIGTKPLPPAFKDRFFPVKLSFPSNSQLRLILEAHGMPRAEAGDGYDYHWSHKVLAFAAQLWDAHQRGQMRYQISPRRLIDAVFLMNIGATDDIKKALEQAVVDAIDSPVEAKVAKQILGGI